nr:hypothetical protein [Tanacetum cinerariifolium]
MLAKVFLLPLKSASGAGIKGDFAWDLHLQLTAVFLEEMMNKEGSREWQLADLLRVEPQFIYYCERAKIDDLRLARQINVLCDTLTNVIDGMWSFVGEMDMLAYKFVPGKMAEFMKEILDKDIPNLMKLQIFGREFELSAREKDLFIEKLKGNMKYIARAVC